MVGDDKKDKSCAYTTISIFDAAPILMMCVMIMFGVKTWIEFNLVVLVIGYSALIVLIKCPESPEWLLINGRREEAIKVFNTIAKWNGG